MFVAGYIAGALTTLVIWVIISLANGQSNMGKT